MLRRFNEYDWMAFAGAQEFGDGSAPLIGEYGPLTVIIDNDGLQAFLMDYEDQAAAIGREDLEYLKDVAERILADCKGLSPRQMLAHLATL